MVFSPQPDDVPDLTYQNIYIYIYIPGTQMTSIFAGQPSKTRPFSIKTRVIWVLGIHISYHLLTHLINPVSYCSFKKTQLEHLRPPTASNPGIKQIRNHPPKSNHGPLKSYEFAPNSESLPRKSIFRSQLLGKLLGGGGVCVKFNSTNISHTGKATKDSGTL